MTNDLNNDNEFTKKQIVALLNIFYNFLLELNLVLAIMVILLWLPNLFKLNMKKIYDFVVGYFLFPSIMTRQLNYFILLFYKNSQDKRTSQISHCAVLLPPSKCDCF